MPHTTDSRSSSFQSRGLPPSSQDPCPTQCESLPPAPAAPPPSGPASTAASKSSSVCEACFVSQAVLPTESMAPYSASSIATSRSARLSGSASARGKHLPPPGDEPVAETVEAVGAAAAIHHHRLPPTACACTTSSVRPGTSAPSAGCHANASARSASETNSAMSPDAPTSRLASSISFSQTCPCPFVTCRIPNSVPIPTLGTHATVAGEARDHGAPSQASFSPKLTPRMSRGLHSSSL